ncbi:MAG TPA: hypothetical protein VGH00_06795 [Chthoniobacterales bacterium]
MDALGSTIEPDRLPVGINVPAELCGSHHLVAGSAEAIVFTLGVIASILFVVTFIRETKGKSPEDM